MAITLFSFPAPKRGITMNLIAHRINTVAQLRQVPTHYGCEIDLRDLGDRLILRHDPFGDGENFADWIQEYQHGTLILNIKSERIEHRVLELVQKQGITNYFFLDSSFPMIRTLVRGGESRIAVRFSEFEPIESCLALAGQVEWVWVDCFTKMPLDETSYSQLRKHFRLCGVSPELQGRSVETIVDYAKELAPFPLDAVCTKRPDLWLAALHQPS
ncbi:MAG: phosphatidylinositol-specific phospholipase C/glycerophosphodiester phosphodiesterase family protein [Gemmataceae bacterium]